MSHKDHKGLRQAQPDGNLKENPLINFNILCRLFFHSVCHAVSVSRIVVYLLTHLEIPTDTRPLHELANKEQIGSFIYQY
jgi:hypothetical protein